MVDITASCGNCIPKIDYVCVQHRPEGYCVGCNRKNMQLFVSAFGIICRDCLNDNGVVFNK